MDLIGSLRLRSIDYSAGNCLGSSFINHNLAFNLRSNLLSGEYLSSSFINNKLACFNRCACEYLCCISVNYKLALNLGSSFLSSDYLCCISIDSEFALCYGSSFNYGLVINNCYDLLTNVESFILRLRCFYCFWSLSNCLKYLSGFKILGNCVCALSLRCFNYSAGNCLGSSFINHNLTLNLRSNLLSSEYLCCRCINHNLAFSDSSLNRSFFCGFNNFLCHRLRNYGINILNLYYGVEDFCNLFNSLRSFVNDSSLNNLCLICKLAYLISGTCDFFLCRSGCDYLMAVLCCNCVLDFGLALNLLRLSRIDCKRVTTLLNILRRCCLKSLCRVGLFCNCVRAYCLRSIFDYWDSSNILLNHYDALILNRLGSGLSFYCSLLLSDNVTTLAFSSFNCSACNYLCRALINYYCTLFSGFACKYLCSVSVNHNLAVFCGYACEYLCSVSVNHNLAVFCGYACEYLCSVSVNHNLAVFCGYACEYLCSIGINHNLAVFCGHACEYLCSVGINYNLTLFNRYILHRSFLNSSFNCLARNLDCGVRMLGNNIAYAITTAGNLSCIFSIYG